MKKTTTNLSLYERVYRELDTKNKDKREMLDVEDGVRYNYNEIGLTRDCEHLLIKSATSEHLDFAQRVAEYFNAKFERGEEAWRKDPSERYFIKINIMD